MESANGYLMCRFTLPLKVRNLSEANFLGKRSKSRQKKIKLKKFDNTLARPQEYI